MSSVHAHPVLRVLAALPLMLASAIAVSTAALAQLPAPSPTPLPATAAASATAPANRIVIQVSDNDPGKWNLALNNAKNIQTDLGAANVAIEIVAYGPGINMLKMDSAVGGRIDEALATGVKVVACENTMRGAKLTKPDMRP